MNINDNYIGIAVHPWIEQAAAEFDYQMKRIAYCKEIIAQKPNTGAARNAQRLIDDINEQLKS